MKKQPDTITDTDMEKIAGLAQHGQDVSDYFTASI
jgi:hypothetical protein